MKNGRPKSEALITARVVAARGGKRQIMLTFHDGPKPRHMRIKTLYAPETTDAMMEEKRLYWLAKYTSAGITGETIEAAKPTGGSDWWDTFFSARETKGLTDTRGMYVAHIEPVLAGKHPREWTKADCERVRDALDVKIQAGTWQGKRRVYRFGWKRARNVWALFTSACKAASSSKNKALRVREDNPCLGVEVPDDGATKIKQWLTPAEFLKLENCSTVPLRWRQFYALLVYTYLRPNELKALLRKDIDLDTGVSHVTKAWDFENDKPKPYTKTAAGVRKVPIEPGLRPLLAFLCEGLGRDDYLFPALPPREDWAATFRVHLKRAGVDRESLYENTPTVKNITLYDLRATGITWRTLRGDDTRKIQREAGHEDYNTTDGYVRDAAVYGTALGVMFPPLPEVLRSHSAITLSKNSLSKRFDAGKMASPRGFEPLLQP
jgi:integrase